MTKPESDSTTFHTQTKQLTANNPRVLPFLFPHAFVTKWKMEKFVLTPQHYQKHRLSPTTLSLSRRAQHLCTEHWLKKTSMPTGFVYYDFVISDSVEQPEAHTHKHTHIHSHTHTLRYKHTHTLTHTHTHTHIYTHTQRHKTS